ncbi:MAG TPA: DUF1583 domain-containing protein, partial [Gemmataceae bacterium]
LALLAALVAAPAHAGDRIAVDFRAGAPAVRNLRLYGPDAARLAKADDRGLRITLPAGRRDPSRDVGVELPIRLRGDFEATLGYELLALPDPAPQNGVGVQLRVNFENPAATAAGITRLRKPPGEEGARPFDVVGPFGETYGATRVDSGPDGKDAYDVRNYRATATRGRLRLARAGGQMVYSVAEGDGPFRQIRTLEIVPEDAVSIRAFAFTGYRAVAIDVRLTDLTVIAAGLPAGTPAAAPGRMEVVDDASPRVSALPAPPAAPPAGGRAHWLLLVAAGAVLLAVAAGLIIVDRRGRRARPVAEPPPAAKPATRGVPAWAVFAVIAAAFGGAIYANLAFAVKNGTDYRYFPPFRPYANANMNSHLGAEYLCIAQALVAGRGFADPFREPTGPTAWMAPVLPVVTAALLWAFDGNRDAVMAAVVFAQVYVLIGTGLLVVAAAVKTGSRGGAAVAAAVFVAALFYDFHFCFQITHDCWLVLLALNLVAAGLIWGTPLATRRRAAAWGLVGGFGALVGPVVGFVWGLLTLAIGVRRSRRAALGVAVLTAGLVMAPWAVRNYAVFGRLIPVKSNAAYELYQSQCLQPDGLIQRSTFNSHPYGSAGRERQEYKALGEMAFVDRKREQFWAAVANDPADFLFHLAHRLAGTTVWYTPFERTEAADRPVAFWLGRLVHPLPFLAAVLLVVTARRRPLHPAQWAVLGVYALYLLPYALVSYYERYGAPLLGVKVLLVVWGFDRLLVLAFGPRPARGGADSPAAQPGRNGVAVAAASASLQQKGLSVEASR